MSIKEIVLYPDDPLMNKAEPFETIGPEVEQLAAEMFETMYVKDGVGLAAPQIGISKQMVVLCNPEDSQEWCLVNPILSQPEGEQENEEGCLSLPAIYAIVKRPNAVHVQAFDQFGHELDFVAEGFLACIIQHEVDHLNGTVFIDRLDFVSREEKFQEWMQFRNEVFPDKGEKAGKQCL